MTTTDKILLAHYFPNIVIFKIYNKINLNFGVTIVALDLKLLRKMAKTFFIKDFNQIFYKIYFGSNVSKIGQ